MKMNTEIYRVPQLCGENERGLLIFSGFQSAAAMQMATREKRGEEDTSVEVGYRCCFQKQTKTILLPFSFWVWTVVGPLACSYFLFSLYHNMKINIYFADRKINFKKPVAYILLSFLWIRKLSSIHFSSSIV